MNRKNSHLIGQASFLFGFLLFVIFPSNMAASIQAGDKWMDPKEILRGLSRADSFVIDLYVFRTAANPNGRKQRVAPAGGSGFLVEEASIVSGILGQLNGPKLTPSFPCFCIGQPFVRFYSKNTFLGSVCVKHDSVLVLVDEVGRGGYYTADKNVADGYYALLSPLIKRAELEAALAEQGVPSLAKEVEKQTAVLKKQVEEELKARNEQLKTLPVLPIGTAPIEQATRPAR